jgi:hypothetical protein
MDKPTRESLGLNAIDYLEEKEKEVFEKIWTIACEGQADDSVKLKALQGLYNKIRPDRTKLDLDVKSQAPYEALMRNLANKTDDLK